jgi:hypothetical protein
MRVAELSPISRKVKEIYHQYMYVCYPTWGDGGEEEKRESSRQTSKVYGFATFREKQQVVEFLEQNRRWLVDCA